LLTTFNTLLIPDIFVVLYEHKYNILVQFSELQTQKADSFGWMSATAWTNMRPL